MYSLQLTCRRAPSALKPPIIQPVPDFHFQEGALSSWRKLGGLTPKASLSCLTLNTTYWV